ncbi:helix-turn-helix domain-containing protein [Streptomyces sp. NRRL S-340]|uniref:helix-turn-helix domain-containing protein n=1 Tax=Streptomyces sp. NRRL S-340 TaxID=1463901 RepID=UPI00068F1AD9|nr:helix-turn-helix transcriptional regulator [Streptomyces sp. NRRL S-340]
MSVEAAQGWGEFGRRLRSRRRQAGLTQLQLGLRVGYHHTLISKLESGLREPPAGLVRRLDSVLETGGELAAIVAAPPGAPSARTPPPLDRKLSGAMPGADAAGDREAWDPRLWPRELPAEGLACPLHGTTGCAVPEQAGLPALLAGLPGLPGGETGAIPSVAVLPGAPVGGADAGAGPQGGAVAESELLHALTAVLACLIREAFDRATAGGVATVERLLRAVVHWAEAVNATGRLPYGQLRLAAQYAQVAGRLRMQRGQSSIGMAWFGNGLGWADAVHDAPARATLLSDMCTLVRLDDDPGSTLAYARAIGAVDSRRRWVATLSYLYQARGYALGHDAAECRRHIALARRGFARLGRRDLLEAPWMAGAEGEMRVESAIGGALRDLAAVTGDRGTARRAVEATERSRALLPAVMRSTRLLLTLRLADGWACAGDPGAAVALAGPVLGEALGSRELMIDAELRGLHARLLADWGDVPEVREYRERLPAAAGARGPARGPGKAAQARP